MVKGLLIGYYNQEPVEAVANEADFREYCRILDCKGIGIYSIEIEGHEFHIVYDEEYQLFPYRAFSTVIFLSKNGKNETGAIGGSVFITGVKILEEEETECGCLTDDEIAILRAHIKYDEDMLHSVLYCPYQEYESII